VRELHDDEADQLDDAMREDYRPLFAFAAATGLRRKECVTLRWSEVHWHAKQIIKPGKGGRTETVVITDTIRAILWPLQGHHPEQVFTFVAQYTRDGRIKGQRYPLTLYGLRKVWDRIRQRASLTDFRFHDIRHDFASKLLRSSRNLKLTQRAMNHRDIKTTSKYAHVLDEQIGDEMEAMERAKKSRKKQRKPLREVS
jgi:integrase